MGSGFKTAALAAGVLLAVASAQAQEKAQAPEQTQMQPVGELTSKLANNIRFGGYYDFEYEDKERIEGQDGEADFDQHRFVLFIGAQPHERIKLFSELEFEHGAQGDDLKFEQAWLDFTLVDNHNFRAGIDLIPVGRLNINHESNLRDFVFRPEVDERLIPTTWFEAGVGLNGKFLDDRVSYQFAVTNGLRESTKPGGIDEIRKMRTLKTSEDDNNDNKALSGRLAIKPWLGTEIGFSGYNGTYVSTPNSNGKQIDSDITFLAIDFSQVWGAFEFKGEYVNVDKDKQSGSATALTGADGGYIEVAYHFFPEFLRDSLVARGFDDPTFTLIGRAETLDFETDGNPDLLDRNIYSIGLNYRPIEQMAFKLSYDFEDRDAAGQEDQNRFGAGVVLGF